jgi:uncharacterized protein (TIGR02677 family)
MHPQSRELFRHVSAERSAYYRSILDVFALAKRQYRLQLRPDEVLAEAAWPGPAPRTEELSVLLTQLADWGNLESQADTSRVSSLNDFYRARYLYRLSHGGEAVEAGLAVFVQTLERRAELQSIALEDIAGRLHELLALSRKPELDVDKIRESLRYLVHVFEGLAENAQAFMAGVARSIELQAAEVTAVVTYKRRLIEYLERFMGDLVRRSDSIARSIDELSPRIDELLRHVAEREARDAAPDDLHDQHDERRKSAERSLRPLRRSLRAAIAPSNCGIAERARARSNSACGGSAPELKNQPLTPVQRSCQIPSRRIKHKSTYRRRSYLGRPRVASERVGGRLNKRAPSRAICSGQPVSRANHSPDPSRQS